MVCHRIIVKVARVETSQDTLTALLLLMRLIPSLILLILIVGASSLADETDDYSELDLQDLMQVELVEVTSVSKRKQAQFEAPAPAFVMNSRDIVRSGATSLPDLLRLVPGLHVARLGSNLWTVTARGLSGETLNKMLVLVDGRTIYNTTLSAVFWELENHPIEDIERIEVIRGPGAVIWGLNAVNGIINITTKNSKDTIGNLISLGGGSEDHAIASFRTGTELGTHDSLKSYITGSTRDALALSDDTQANDSWQSARGGVRWDLNRDNDVVTVLADVAWSAGRASGAALNLDSEEFFARDYRQTDGVSAHVLSRWDRSLSRESDVAVLGFVDRVERQGSNGQTVRINTAQLEFQHHFRASDSHDLVWGADGRWTGDSIVGSDVAEFNDSSESWLIGNLLLQDEIKIAPDILVSLGSKYTYHELTGSELQPGVTATYLGQEDQVVWASFNRAVRIPSRAELSGVALTQISPAGDTGSPGQLIRAQGGSDIASEEVVSYQLGYRNQVNSSIYLDVAGFYNDYSNVIGIAPRRDLDFVQGVNGPISILLVDFVDAGSIITRGGDFLVKLKAAPNWDLALQYTYLDQVSKLGQQAFEFISAPSPEHSLVLRSLLNIGEQLQLDATLRYSGEGKAKLENKSVPEYTELDLRLGWLLGSDLQFSIMGNNLLSPRHREYGILDDGSLAAHVERSVFARVQYGFQ